MLLETRVELSPRYQNSHTVRLGQARDKLSYLALESDNIGDVTDGLRYSDEIPPGPLLYQISRSLIAVRTC